MENGGVQPTTLGPTVVYGTLLTVVKDAPPGQIPELSVPIPRDYEEVLRESKTP